MQLERMVISVCLGFDHSVLAVSSRAARVVCMPLCVVTCCVSMSSMDYSGGVFLVLGICVGCVECFQWIAVLVVFISGSCRGFRRGRGCPSTYHVAGCGAVGTVVRRGTAILVAVVVNAVVAEVFIADSGVLIAVGSAPSNIFVNTSSTHQPRNSTCVQCFRSL